MLSTSFSILNSQTHLPYTNILGKRMAISCQDDAGEATY